MDMREKLARAMARKLIEQGDALDCGDDPDMADTIPVEGWASLESFRFDGSIYLWGLADAVLDALMEPDEGMIAAALPHVDAPSYEQQQLGKRALTLLPPVRIEQRFKGEVAASEMVRDWQAMIDAACTPEAHVEPGEEG